MFSRMVSVPASSTVMSHPAGSPVSVSVTEANGYSLVSLSVLVVVSATRMFVIALVAEATAQVARTFSLKPVVELNVLAIRFAAVSASQVPP